MALVRIGRFKALPDRMEELRAIYELEAIPAIRAAKGNVSAVLLQDHAERESFMAITIWSGVEDAERYESSGQASAMVDKIRFAFAGSPVLNTYDAFGIA
ncbi:MULTISPECIES: antibiotic biosynthesis monooxygenase [unclassified Mesorhizobium]|uniref:putative quinol monooxygenase n=1 Tax=unclassified Mesorhizobium TaxID=325217 RepID=UPI000960BEEE|nr:MULTISPECIES: antibiotic biosynthesis monooxygenase [unclassified Mesorhizobium]MBN9258203.1 antibiotic biosynthesis monooxygenase [Mesorhizobium sp.]OJX74584.1 MAG: antibiotic biosynthesis monooxygenase [Mesorhizobium sp. 65-26]